MESAISGVVQAESFGFAFVLVLWLYPLDSILEETA
jgi:hypothetical protein